MKKILGAMVLVALTATTTLGQAQEFPSASEAVAEQAKSQFERLLKENPHELAKRARQLGSEIQVTAKYGIELARAKKRLELSERFRIESVNELEVVQAQTKDLKMMLQAEVDAIYESTSNVGQRNKQMARIAAAFKPQLDHLGKQEIALRDQVKATSEYIETLDNGIAGLEREIRLTKKGFTPNKTVAADLADIRKMYGSDQGATAGEELFSSHEGAVQNQTAAIEYLKQVGITSK